MILLFENFYDSFSFIDVGPDWVGDNNAVSEGIWLTLNGLLIPKMLDFADT